MTQSLLGYVSAGSGPQRSEVFCITLNRLPNVL